MKTKTKSKKHSIALKLAHAIAPAFSSLSIAIKIAYACLGNAEKSQTIRCRLSTAARIWGELGNFEKEIACYNALLAIYSAE